MKVKSVAGCPQIHSNIINQPRELLLCLFKKKQIDCHKLEFKWKNNKINICKYNKIN